MKLSNRDFHRLALPLAILLLLWAQLALGLSSIFVSAYNLDGYEMVKLMNWAQGIVTAQPSAAAYLADGPGSYAVPPRLPEAEMAEIARQLAEG